VKVLKVLLLVGFLYLIFLFAFELTYLINPSFNLLMEIESHLPFLRYLHLSTISVKADVYFILPAMFIAIFITFFGFERGRLLLIQVMLVKILFDLLITPVIILGTPQILGSEYILILAPGFLWYFLTFIVILIITWINTTFPRESFQGTILKDINTGIVDAPEFFAENIREVYFRSK